MRKKTYRILIILLAGFFLFLYLANIFSHRSLYKEIVEIRRHKEPVSREELLHFAGFEENLFYPQWVKIREKIPSPQPWWEEALQTPYPDWDEGIREKVSEEVERNRDFYRELTPILLVKKGFFPLKFKEGETSLTHIKEVERVLDLLFLKAGYEWWKGKAENSVRALLEGFLLLDFMKEPLLESQIKKMDFLSKLLLRLQEVLKEREIDPELYRKIHLILKKEREEDFVSLGLVGVRVRVMEAFQDFREGRRERLKALIKKEGGEEIKFPRYYTFPLFRFLNYRDEILTLRGLANLIYWGRQRFWEAKKSFQGLKEQLRKAFTRYPVLSHLLPLYPPLIEKEVELDARLEALKGFLALRYYKSKGKEYPSALTRDKIFEITSTFFSGESPPRDPYTGRWCRYIKKREGFIIYSMGENEKDDSGIVPLDIVWESKI